MNRYNSTEYLQQNPDWHVKDSAWKADQVLTMINSNQITPNTVCEVGCGAGEILALLQKTMGDQCILQGYDISPQAIELAQTRSNSHLQFQQLDFVNETSDIFDLILIIDLIEHLENPFKFLQAIKKRSQYKIFHIPLDLYVISILRSQSILRSRTKYGHIHYYTKELAFASIEDAGYKILDHFYTPSVDITATSLRAKLIKYPRKLFFKLNQDLAVRIPGGYSLLILAE